MKHSSHRIVETLLAASLLVAGACGPGTPPPETPWTPDSGTTDTPDAGPTVDAGGVAGYPWKLIWRDEFEGPANQRPDTNNWRPEVGGDGWGNEQLEFDTDRVENASLDGNGNLAITARRESFGGRNYTSARLVSAGKFSRRYGRFEARIKQPFGQGIWPAFWMLGADIGSVGWPECGEIDIMEYRGQARRNVRGSLHGPGHHGGGNHGREIDVGEDLSADFHTYVVEWDPERVIWKIDDRVYFTATPADLPPEGRWVYDKNMFLILNVAVGGNFVGSPNSSTQFPQTMLVDYVRVYERMP